MREKSPTVPLERTETPSSVAPWPIHTSRSSRQAVMRQARPCRVGRPPRHTVEGGDERRTVAVDGGHVGDLGGQAAVNPYRAAAVLVHDGHLRAVSESAFAAAFQADDLFDERSCADVVVADAGVADAHARCEPDTAAQPCAAQLRGVEVLRHLDRRPVVGRRAGGFERSDFAGGQSSVCVHSRHISNLQI